MTTCRIVSGVAAAMCLAASAIGAPPRFPFRVAETRRHLVDQAGRPLLVHGDSPWESVWRLTREEMAEYLDHRAAQGFNTVLRARWFDRTTGQYSAAATAPLPNEGERTPWPPARDADGDWALVLEAERR